MDKNNITYFNKYIIWIDVCMCPSDLLNDYKG